MFATNWILDEVSEAHLLINACKFFQNDKPIADLLFVFWLGTQSVPSIGEQLCADSNCLWRRFDLMAILKEFEKASTYFMMVCEESIENSVSFDFDGKTKQKLD